MLSTRECEEGERQEAPRTPKKPPHRPHRAATACRPAATRGRSPRQQTNAPTEGFRRRRYFSVRGLCCMSATLERLGSMAAAYRMIVYVESGARSWSTVSGVSVHGVSDAASGRAPVPIVLTGGARRTHQYAPRRRGGFHGSVSTLAPGSVSGCSMHAPWLLDRPPGRSMCSECYRRLGAGWRATAHRHC